MGIKAFEREDNEQRGRWAQVMIRSYHKELRYWFREQQESHSDKGYGEVCEAEIRRLRSKIKNMERK
jgi:hypothetical protein